MPSVLKNLLDNLQAQITENASNIETNTTDISEALTRITTAEGDITELGNELNTTNSSLSAVRSEVTTARGGQANLNTRLNNMTTSITEAADAAENAQSAATTAQTTANEAAAQANTANSAITAATGSFDTLAARLNDMDTDITNVTADTSSNTDDITSIQNEITNARRGFNSLYTTIGASSMSGIGKTFDQSTQSTWANMPLNTTYYYDAQGNALESSENAVYSILKYDNLPIALMISIANILTVTSEMLIQSTISPITVDGVLYSVYFIKFPDVVFNSSRSLSNSFVSSPFIVSANPSTITAENLGSVDSLNSNATSSSANLYLPVLRPSTSPGTVFKFLRTSLDPDTNTVQYTTFNSNITVFL